MGRADRWLGAATALALLLLLCGLRLRWVLLTAAGAVLGTACVLVSLR